MDLLITGFGSRLNVRDGCFEVSREGGADRDAIAPSRVRAILLGDAVFVTTAALRLAREHKVDVLVLDFHGDPIGRFWMAGGGSTAAIRRAQLRAAEGPFGLEFARAWVAHKLGNQRRLLLRMIGRRPDLSSASRDALRGIEAQEQYLRSDQPVGEQSRLFGAEAAAARAFWPALSALLPERWRFEGRSRQPAEDPFNAALNYAYGLLYGRVSRAVMIAGLDPDLGFLHGDRHGKPSLVCDFIEPFRLFADRPVAALFSRSRLAEDAFEACEGGTRLGNTGRRSVVESVLRYLDGRVTHHGRQVKREHVIQLEAHRLANELPEGRPPELPAWEV